MTGACREFSFGDLEIVASSRGGGRSQHNIGTLQLLLAHRNSVKSDRPSSAFEFLPTPSGGQMIEGWMERPNPFSRASLPVIRVRVFNPNNPELQCNAKLVVDTGYSGSISLEKELIKDLGLEPDDFHNMAFGDGQEKRVPTFKGSVSWDGQDMKVVIEELAKGLMLHTGLVGMELFSNMKLTVVPSTGCVRIEPYLPDSGHASPQNA